MKSLFITLLSASLLFASCSKEQLEGNGHIVTEVRTLSSFSGVQNSGSKHIHVAYGPEYKVELRGSSNLIPAYETTIRNGTLHLSYERVNVRRDDLEVYVTTPEIRRAFLSGSGKILISGDFPAQDYFETRISGSGDVKVYDDFEAANVDVSVSGSGEADLQRIESPQAEVNISGSGDVKVNATDRLKLKISGSGKVFYLGSPVIDSSISGSGKVIKMN